jgi:hypothetical protein
MSGGFSITTGAVKFSNTADMPILVIFKALNAAAAEESRQFGSSGRWEVSALH